MSRSPARAPLVRPVGTALRRKLALKFARTPDHTFQLHDEPPAPPPKLRRPVIIALRDAFEKNGHTVLVLAKPDDETLSVRSALEQPEHTGDDLLTALGSPEDAGISHRDIEPDDFAVRAGKQRLQIVLCDFSLSQARRKASTSARAIPSTWFTASASRPVGNRPRSGSWLPARLPR